MGDIEEVAVLTSLPQLDTIRELDGHLSRQRETFQACLIETQ
ncbi:hypothetical protein ACVPOY_01530 [Staphylococcus aureus]